MFLAPWRIGFFPTLIDKVRMDTPWGEKELDRSIIFWPDMEGGFLMNVMYGGGETYLNYRQDIITSQWRASMWLRQNSRRASSTCSRCIAPASRRASS